jgi:hypothetical protein
LELRISAACPAQLLDVVETIRLAVVDFPLEVNREPVSTAWQGINQEAVAFETLETLSSDPQSENGTSFYKRVGVGHGGYTKKPTNIKTSGGNINGTVDRGGGGSRGGGRGPAWKQQYQNQHFIMPPNQQYRRMMRPPQMFPMYGMPMMQGQQMSHYVSDGPFNNGPGGYYMSHSVSPLPQMHQAKSDVQDITQAFAQSFSPFTDGPWMPVAREADDDHASQSSDGHSTQVVAYQGGHMPQERAATAAVGGGAAWSYGGQPEGMIWPLHPHGMMQPPQMVPMQPWMGPPSFQAPPPHNWHPSPHSQSW